MRVVPPTGSPRMCPVHSGNPARCAVGQLLMRKPRGSPSWEHEGKTIDAIIAGGLRDCCRKAQALLHQGRPREIRVSTGGVARVRPGTGLRPGISRDPKREFRMGWPFLRPPEDPVVVEHLPWQLALRGEDEARLAEGEMHRTLCSEVSRALLTQKFPAHLSLSRKLT